MATLTDEERAAQILGNVEESSPAETTEEPIAPTEAEQETPDTEEPEEESSEEEKPEEDEAEPEKSVDSSFTKQFPNLKGDTPEEYVPELEKAYDNSFKEALRLNQIIKDQEAVVAQARAIIESQGNPNPATTPQNPATPVSVNPLTAIDEHPAIKYAKQKQTEDMLSAFDVFKKDYPQATEQQSFETFTKASDGVNLALTNSLGRAPTYPELFKGIAGSLGWQPLKATARRDAAIKENASSSRVVSGTAPKRKTPRVPDAAVDAYMKMYTFKTREEAVKELSEVV